MGKAHLKREGEGYKWKTKTNLSVKRGLNRPSKILEPCERFVKWLEHLEKEGEKRLPVRLSNTFTVASFFKILADLVVKFPDFLF